MDGCESQSKSKTKTPSSGTVVGREIGELLSFSNDGQEAIHRTTNIVDEQVPEKDLSDEELSRVFELESCQAWMAANNYQKTCLQFPDNLLQHSTRIAAQLEALVGHRLYILADSTYGSCCVDEKTAKHINADSLVHFGPSCLTTTNNSIPVHYVFTKPAINTDSAALDSLISVFRSNFQNLADRILILFDVHFEYAANELWSLVRDSYPSLVVSGLIIPGEKNTKDEPDPDKVILNGRQFPRSWLTEEPGQIFYIGSNSKTILSFLRSALGVSKAFTTYNPSTRGLSVERQELIGFLMKRGYYIERLKDCRSVGILVGTLAVQNHLLMIEQLKAVLKSVGKKVYTVAIGQITPPKLANFADIEVFVLISCPESSILDSKEFYQPIVTPYEVEVAFNQARKWTPNMVQDFRVLLPGGTEHVPFEMGEEEDCGDVSLITNRSRGQTFREEDVADSSLEPHSLNWAGLSVSEDTGHSGVVEGKVGIPSSYESEPKK